MGFRDLICSLSLLDTSMFKTSSVSLWHVGLESSDYSINSPVAGSGMGGQCEQGPVTVRL